MAPEGEGDDAVEPAAGPEPAVAPPDVIVEAAANNNDDELPLTSLPEGVTEAGAPSAQGPDNEDDSPDEPEEPPDPDQRSPSERLLGCGHQMKK